MEIPETCLNQLKCCAFNDGHIAIEPVLVKCGANACKECIKSTKGEVIKCFNCNGILLKQKIQLIHQKVNHLNPWSILPE